MVHVILPMDAVFDRQKLRLSMHSVFYGHDVDEKMADEAEATLKGGYTIDGHVDAVAPLKGSERWKQRIKQNLNEVVLNKLDLFLRDSAVQCLNALSSKVDLTVFAFGDQRLYGEVVEHSKLGALVRGGVRLLDRGIDIGTAVRSVTARIGTTVYIDHDKGRLLTVSAAIPKVKLGRLNEFSREESGPDAPWTELSSYQAIITFFKTLNVVLPEESQNPLVSADKIAVAPVSSPDEDDEADVDNDTDLEPPTIH